MTSLGPTRTVKQESSGFRAVRVKSYLPGHKKKQQFFRALASFPIGAISAQCTNNNGGCHLYTYLRGGFHDGLLSL